MKKQTKVWITATGEKVRICDMTDAHLLNTIHFLERQEVCKEHSLHKFHEGILEELAALDRGPDEVGINHKVGTFTTEQGYRDVEEFCNNKPEEPVGREDIVDVLSKGITEVTNEY